MKRWPASEKLEEDRAQRIHVNRRPDRLNPPGRLLRGHVTGRTQDVSIPRPSGAITVETFSQTEVRNFRNDR